MTVFWRYCLSSLTVCIVCLVMPSPVRGQVKPLLDNDHVRIYEATMAVGAKTREHSHPADEATYVLSGGKVKITLPDGTVRTRELKTGDVLWNSTSETHVAENLGDTEIRLLTIELKKSQGQGQQSGREP